MEQWFIAAITGGVVGVVILFWALRQPKRFCPDCGISVPKFRKPKTAKEAWWGGWTCSKCGCKIDRKGQKIKK